MTTMNDIVVAALRRLRVVNPRETVDATLASDGLEALNQMISSWKARGVDVGHFDLEAADDFPLDDEFRQAAVALLAVRLSSDHGIDVDNGIVLDATNGWNALLAEYVQPVDTEFDIALQRTGRLFQ